MNLTTFLDQVSKYKVLNNNYAQCSSFKTKKRKLLYGCSFPFYYINTPVNSSLYEDKILKLLNKWHCDNRMRRFSTAHVLSFIDHDTEPVQSTYQPHIPLSQDPSPWSSNKMFYLLHSHVESVLCHYDMKWRQVADTGGDLQIWRIVRSDSGQGVVFQLWGWAGAFCASSCKHSNKPMGSMK
jgi:hypothetical protein